MLKVKRTRGEAVGIYAVEGYAPERQSEIAAVIVIIVVGVDRAIVQVLMQNRHY